MLGRLLDMLRRWRAPAGPDRRSLLAPSNDEATDDEVERRARSSDGPPAPGVPPPPD